MTDNHALRAAYWELVLAQLEALHHEMVLMRPTVEDLLLNGRHGYKNGRFD